MRILLFLLPGFVVVSPGCSPDNHAPSLSAATVQTQYDSLKQDNEERRQWFKRVYTQDSESRKKERLLEARNYMFRVMRKEVFPRWKDTKWDFNGTTTSPQTGKIACGYFVTTTLYQMGFKIERARLAQQAASKIIATLCDPSSLKIIGHNQHDKLLKHLEKQKNGLYIIGLDNHVGFILKEPGGTWMVHSTSYPHGKVVKEDVKTSPNLKRSKSYYIADLLGNEAILKKWINGESIPTKL